MKYSASGLIAGLLLLGASVSAQDDSIKQQVVAGSEKVQPVLRASVSAYLAQQKAGKPGTSETFPVIVNIDPGTYGDRNTFRRAFGNSQNLAILRGQIRSSQNRAISQLFPGAASRVITRYQNMFAFSIDLTANEIEQVAQQTDVTLVHQWQFQ